MNDKKNFIGLKMMMQKFGYGNDNWPKMKDLLYCYLNLQQNIMK